MKSFDATIVATIIMSVDAETRQEAIEKVRYAIPSKKLSKDASRVIYNLHIEDIILTEAGIMDASNGHDPKLVDKINQCYSKKINLFFAIVRLLAERDVDEIGDICDTNIDDMAKKDLARLYCNRIADDQDLVTIINYCRM